MKRYLSLLFFILVAFTAGSQVTGKAFLNGQTIHSSIQVKFIAAGGNALTDSTTTTYSGDYSINITPGLYHIVFSKNTYQDYYYNNGNAVMLNGNEILNNVTLLGGQFNVHGNVSGIWLSGSTYFVIGDITVLPGQTLTIQPGAIVSFKGEYNFMVYGTLLANGTSAQPILFTSGSILPTLGDWNGITIDSSPGSIINHCIMEYGTEALYISYCSPIITNKVIRNMNGAAIETTKSGAWISGNYIHGTNGGVVPAILCYETDSITIECNTIDDFSGSGIECFLSGGIIRNNHFRNIVNPAGFSTIILSDSCNSLIENNYFQHCTEAIRIVGRNNPALKPHPRIINNTIAYSQHAGVILGSINANAEIINNIFFNCDTALHQIAPSCGPSCSTTPSVVANNLTWNNVHGDYVDVQIPGLGNITTLNGSGNPTDAFYNLAMDPLFVNNIPPTLSSGSPCMSVGGSGYSENIGYDSTFTCFAQTLQVNTLYKNRPAVLVYPNPAHNTICIKVNNSSAKNVQLKIMSLLGEELDRITKNTSDNMFFTDLDISCLDPGIYMVSLSEGHGIWTSVKFIKQ